ncbi:MAG: permease [Clostridium sp.]|nr:permease [Clostridium sp.]MCM1459013.1 permease [Bacteroides sp.]
MSKVFEVVQREFVYISYYFMFQLRQIVGYWILGMVIGSLVSVFAKDAIHNAFDRIRDKKWGIWGIIPASLLGVVSPLCMYGTIPIAASFSRHGMRDDWLAAFMMSSVLLNPQLIMYSTVLGAVALTVRIISCTVCGIVAGLVVHMFYKNKSFFNFDGFEPRASHDTHPNPFLRLLFNLGRNVRATALWFLVGVLLSALFQRYVPADRFAELFGKSNEGFGILMAATIGVPIYACGGGTIPLIREWLAMGMSMGSASAFMITGPATKITNLGALKIVLGIKRFILYIAFVMVFSLVTGLIANMLLAY